ncbi:MAG: GNAT family N-acetyltransferase [Candidatus Heimdallarchaeota archaeon]|nr:GNAT family N-acetyltransferase [Candidatus Heimdallarchaeota archaeon]MCK4769585.1 GNAT family N-acetyltransferase [Candidatus Heimdallarchaeota archaeon]
MTNFEYKEMLDFSEYDILEDLQEDAWGMPARELVPKRLIYATLKSGGVVIGAYKNNEIIGYCWGWVGNKDPYGLFIYSHHNAVRQEYQNQGIGLQLKLAQRDWALKHNYHLINWTFDPLQSKNCYLNLHKLGVECSTYKRNYWGEMVDILNKGIDTDRFYSNWYIRSKHVEKRIQGKIENFSELLLESNCKVFETQITNNKITVKKTHLEINSQFVFIEIPSNFNELMKEDKESLIQWRKETRTAFETYFNKGYKAIDFVVEKETEIIRCFHILKKEENGN